MEDDRGTKSLAGSVLGGLLFVAAAVLWSATLITTAIIKGTAAYEASEMRVVAFVAFSFGMIVLMRRPGSRPLKS
jgi:hypothetical protein